MVRIEREQLARGVARQMIRRGFFALLMLLISVGLDRGVGVWPWWGVAWTLLTLTMLALALSDLSRWFRLQSWLKRQPSSYSSHLSL